MGDPYRGSVLVEPFRLGDSVVLKSGGPEMTIEHIYASDKIECVWFDYEARWQGPFRATFPPEALVKYVEEEDD